MHFMFRTNVLVNRKIDILDYWYWDVKLQKSISFAQICGRMGLVHELAYV